MLRFTIMRSVRGFALIELLISVAILLVLSAMTYQVFQTTNNMKALDTESLKLLTQLRTARSFTLASKNASQWGVRVASTSVTLFEGSSYDAASPSNVVSTFNRLVVASTISLAGGGSDIIFERLTGEVDQSGNITLSLVASSSVKRIMTVHHTGIVEIQ